MGTCLAILYACELLMPLQQFGVVPVLISESRENPDERVPYIAPYTSWTLKYFARSDSGPRQYAVTYNDS